MKIRHRIRRYYKMNRCTAPFIGALAGAWLAAGCARTVQFKAVDEATGRPLAGVDTSWRQDSRDSLLGSYHYGPANLPPSKEDGVIVVDGIYRRKLNEFIFSRDGYATVYGIYSRGIFGRADRTNSVSVLRGFIPDGPLTNVPPTNGFIAVQMKRK
jgi:hypothetical protein